MTASIKPESKSPSRRALLAGAVGGLGAVAASAIGRVSPVRANPGDPVLVDGSHTGMGATQITTSGTSGFFGVSSAAGGVGIRGEATAASGSAWGVVGTTASTDGTGVRGYASAPNGVTFGISGQNDSTSGRGVLGSANAASGTTFGVRGTSSSTSGTGVLGYAPATSGATRGVSGQSESTSGTGVQGLAGATSGTTYGVLAQSYSSSGAALRAIASGGGLAIQSTGRAKFSTSGVATIRAGSTSKTIAPGVNVKSSSFVLLTPKVKLSGRDLWFTTNATGNEFTIHMSSSRSSGTKVAWLLLG